LYTNTDNRVPSKRFEQETPRNPRNVDLKAWYQISAKLHKTFENILTCEVIKMKPTNCSSKNYVAHGTTTTTAAAAADDDDNDHGALVHGIICEPVLDS